MRPALLLAACLAVLSAPAQAAQTIAVVINDIAYAPASISAHVGDTIVWTNRDIVAHTATARDQSWDLTIMPQKSKKLTLKKTGSFEYFCRFHPNMVGHITVSAP